MLLRLFLILAARYRVYAPGFEATQVQAESEAVLSQCGNYVPASLRVDPTSRTISFQFHGPESLGHQYRTLLAMTKKAALMPVSPELPANARPPQ